MGTWWHACASCLAWQVKSGDAWSMHAWHESFQALWLCKQLANVEINCISWGLPISHEECDAKNLTILLSFKLTKTPIYHT